MKVEAHAKINLALDVVKRREDGYHDLRMIMLPLQLHDTLHVELAQQDELTCDGERMPLGENNLIFKALRYLRECWDLQGCFRIHVEKRIPMEAGLAGGSADAGAIIRAALSLNDRESDISKVARGAKQVGADVPFCVLDQSARVEGIGDVVIPLSDHCDFDILLVKPPTGVSTGKAYQTLDFTCAVHPDIDRVQQCLLNDDYTQLCKSLGNTLEQSAFLLNPEVAKLKQSLISNGVDAALMSGSGSTVFALGRDRRLLLDLQQLYAEKGYFAAVTSRKR